jgi:glycosyltransferase involved in cell wall biosynthesis
MNPAYANQPCGRRVLHVLGALERGGVETWLLELAERLEGTGWYFDFCSLGPEAGRYRPRVEAAGGRVWPCPVGEPGFSRRLYRLLRLGRYDVVHSHVHYFSGAVLALAAAARVPARVAHSHNTADGHISTLARRCYRGGARRLLNASLTRGLACSSDAAAALFGPAWQQDPRITVLRYGIAPGVEPSPELRAALRHELGTPLATPLIGHVGRLEPPKNHAFLLEVAAALHRERPKIVWVLAGEGSERHRIEQRLAALGLNRAVRLLGRREDVPRLLAALDAAVLPSLYEGLPLALLEAQAGGLRAVVSSRITPEAAVVREAVEFLTLEAGPEVWARRVAAAVDGGRLPCREAAPQLRAAGFAIDQSLARLLELYSRDTKQRAAPEGHGWEAAPGTGAPLALRPPR